MPFKKVKDLKLHIRKEHLGISDQDIQILNTGNKYPVTELSQYEIKTDK